MNFLAYLGQNIEYFVLVFLFFLMVFFCLRKLFKIKHKKALKIQRKFKSTPTIYGNTSNDSGVILISKPIKPYGNKITLNYDVNIEQVISSINYKGVFDLKLILDKTIEKEEIIIKGDQAFAELIEFEYINNNLFIKHKQISCTYDLDCRIIIYLKSLERFSNKGSGEIEIVGINSTSFSFYNSGYQDVSLSGRTDYLHINNSSTGSLFANDCKATKGHIENTNSGHVTANIEHSVHCVITDTGNIKLLNKPNNVTYKLTGKGILFYRPIEETFKDYIYFKLRLIKEQLKNR